jgi:GTP1/Obg family GTP-binding protein
MYNVEELYKALQAGASADDMVRQFTDAMNAAIRQKNEDDQKTKQTYARKVAAMQAIIGDLCDFLVEFYPELPITDDLRGSIDATDILESLDEAVNQVRSVTNFVKNIPVEKHKPNEDAIARFLKANGLN